MGEKWLRRAMVPAMLATVAASGAAWAETNSDASVASDPSRLEIPAFSYPPSALMSAEQREAYIRSLDTLGDGTIQMQSSPQVVAMMRAHVNASFTERLKMVEAHYPTVSTTETIGGVEVMRVRPKGGVTPGNEKRILINIHGGAFMVGWPSVAILDAAPVAALSGMEVFTINYRMFPEATHPAALEDLAAVYREILKDYAPENIGIFGGSAGGVVTLQSIGWFDKHGLPLPGAVAPLACGFQTAIGDSAIWNFNGGFSNPGTQLVQTGGYLGDRDRRDPVDDADMETRKLFPPTLWMAGTRAPEMSGAIVGHSSLLKEGVDSQLYMIEGGWHSSYSTAPETPESQDAMKYIAVWFDKKLGR